MVQIGSDGGLLPAPVKRTSIPLEPAERVDVIVDFRQFGVGSKVILHNTVGEAVDAARSCASTSSSGGAEEARIPKRLRRGGGAAGGQRGALVAADLPGARRRRSMWQIAGGGFSEMRIDCRPRQGSTELWTWRQPVQAHAPDAPARLPLPGRQHRTASRRIRATAGWKDTVAVLSATRPSSCGRTSTTSRGRLRLPLPRRRARRHVDDGPDGGRRMRRAAHRGAARRWRSRRPGRRRARGGHAPVQAFDHADGFTPVWTPNDVPAQVGDTIKWRFTQPGNANAAVHPRHLARRARAWQPQQLGASYLGPKVDATVDDRRHLPVLLLHPRRHHARDDHRRGRRPDPRCGPGPPWESPAPPSWSATAQRRS